MIADFDDFVTWMFVLIDDICNRLRRCIGVPAPNLSALTAN